MHAFSPDGACRRPAVRRPRVAAAQRAPRRAADPRRGDLALQPHRRAASSTGSPGRATTTIEGGAGIVVDRADLAELPDVIGAETPDIFGELNTAFMAPIVVRVPAGHRRRRADRRSPTRSPATGPPCSRASSSMPAPTARSPSSSGSRRPTATSCSSSRCSRCAPRRPPGSATSASTSSSESAWQIGHQQAVGERDSTHHAGHGRPRRPLRPGPHRGPPRRPRRQHPPGRPVLRRRRADARLPHDPGPRRAAHDQRPAVQGRGAGPLAQRLHRPDQDPQGRQGHRRPSRPTAT